ncbi:MAG TPA: hypothetical protein VF592_01345 [Sphingomonas sp.]|uniref:hypothetical protein n=1 Tax=Sphingomonas sp. TaxID=28214 RepID=UPI002ED79057
MKRLVLGAAMALGLAAPVQAAMTVGEFIAKANALSAKGPMALFSSDLGLLKREMTGVARQLKAEGAQRRAAGLPPRACPPKGAKMGPAELMSAMNAIPPAERGMSLKDGFVRAMSARFPCR